MTDAHAKLLHELEQLAYDSTRHARRRDIGEALASLGDERDGVGVRDELPDVQWLSVAGTGDDEQSASIKLDDFFIAQYPVTYAQYQVFAEGDFSNPQWWAGFPDGTRPQALAPAKNSASNAPRDSVSWYQAVAFARWLNAQYVAQDWFEQQFSLSAKTHELRLPTESEWQWAAQNGHEARAYPWGEWQAGYANTREADLGQTIAVGMYPHAQAQCGALGMTGNTCEWCMNKVDAPHQWQIDASGDKRVLRGGSYLDDYDMGQVDFRFGDDTPDVISGLNGFRLVIAPR
jgi:formylglycine-generating enzyme required for sulfatase activity